MYSVIWCDEWDWDQGEPKGGGRCLAEAPTLHEARTLALGWVEQIAYWSTRPVMARFAGWLGIDTTAAAMGAGCVIVTNDGGRYVCGYHSKTRVSARAA